MAGAAAKQAIAEAFGATPVQAAPSPVSGMTQEDLMNLQGFTGFDPLEQFIPPEFLGGIAFGNPLLQTLGLGDANLGLLSQVPIIPQEDIFGTAPDLFAQQTNPFFGLLGQA